MNDLTSKLYTSFAFVSISTIILSNLYRKRQITVECTCEFWNQCWEYIVRKEKYDKSINDHDDAGEVFEISVTSLTRIEIYNNIYYSLHLSKPSHTVTKFISQMIDIKLKQLVNNNKIQPVTILVPLCGCSYDLYYISLLLQNKYKLSPKLFKIIGIESSVMAIRNFFTQNQMGWIQSSYNPKYMKTADFYRIAIYSNLTNSIHIINNDIFQYFDLSQHLQYIGIENSPCLIKQKSIDIIIDINAMSCINPSHRLQYSYAMKYWLKDNGLMLLNTHFYDPKLSNYPPFTLHSTDIYELFGMDKCKLLHSENDINHNSTSQSWLIN